MGLSRREAEEEGEERRGEVGGDRERNHGSQRDLYTYTAHHLLLVLYLKHTAGLLGHKQAHIR